MTSLADLSHLLELAHHELAEHRASIEQIHADFQEAKTEMMLRMRYQQRKIRSLDQEVNQLTERVEVNERKADKWKKEYEECQKTLDQKQRLLDHYGDGLKQIFHPNTKIEVTLPPPKTRRSVPVAETNINTPNNDEVEGGVPRPILKLSFAGDVNQELEDDPEGTPIPTSSSRPFKRSRRIILSETEEEEGGLPSADLNAAQSSTEESDELTLVVKSAKKVKYSTSAERKSTRTYHLLQTKHKHKRSRRPRPARGEGAKNGPATYGKN